jgi:hypothetical protein
MRRIALPLATTVAASLLWQLSPLLTRIWVHERERLRESRSVRTRA